MQLNTMHDLFIDCLKDLYSAEMQITKALPKMMRAASNPQLKAAFEKHLGETEQQAQRLEQLITGFGAKTGGKKCKGMEGLIEEGAELMEMTGAPEVIDAGLIGAAQKIEHYEISGYGTARAMAQLMGHSEAVRVLDQTLDEESATDENLSMLAETVINPSAPMGMDGGSGRSSR
jgi:ferritin-like metal-binding protein YciE